VKNRIGLIALLILLNFLAGCGGPKRDIVGKWRTTGDPGSAMVWEFGTDGSVQMGSIRARYSFDGERMKIQTSAGSSIYQFALAGDQMTLRGPGGNKLEFNRSQ